MTPMMKQLQLALALALLSSASVLADDVKVDGDKLVGTWEAVKGSETLPLGSTLEFTKEGKLKLNIKGAQPQQLEGTYKIDGAAIKIVLKVQGEEKGETLKVSKMSDTELVIVDEMKKKDVLNKKK
jgi:uncharacterized protein (TIGR03066 family)